MGDYNNMFQSLRISENGSPVYAGTGGGGMRVQGQVPQGMTKPAPGPPPGHPHPHPGMAMMRGSPQPTNNGNNKPIHYHSMSTGSNPQQQAAAAMMMMNQQQQQQRQAPPGSNYSPTHSISGVSQHSGSRASLTGGGAAGNYGHSQLVYENLDYYGGDNGNG